MSRVNFQENMDVKKHNLSNNIIVPGIMSENTLRVWRALPSEIRHDPTMATFQTENDRIYGAEMFTENKTNDNTNDGETVDCIVMKDLNHTQDAVNNEKSDEDGEIEKNDKTTTVEPLELPQLTTKVNEEKRVKIYKRVVLTIIWIFIVGVLMSVNENYPLKKLLVVPKNTTKIFLLPNNPSGNFKISLLGAFATINNNDTENQLIIQPKIMYFDKKTKSLVQKNFLVQWNLSLIAEGSFDTADVLYKSRTFEISNHMLEILSKPNTTMYLNMQQTNTEHDITVELNYNSIIIDIKLGTLLAACILISFYCILMWEIFHRTFAAILCSTLSLVALACFNDRPNMQEIVQWLNMELLTLIFCMMIIVGILTETGVFDYLSVVAFEISRGKVWPMISCLCIITCLMSAFLDNVTTVLFMIPVAIRLCEVMALNPVPVIMGIIVMANIGGIMTPIGDPVSIIIYSHPYLVENNITFIKFVSHAIPGVILVVLQSLIYMRIIFRDKKSLLLNEPKEVKEMRRHILTWQRASNSISLFSKDASLVRQKINRKIKELKNCLKESLRATKSGNDVYVLTLEELKQKYPVKDKATLFKTCFTLIFIMFAFVLQSVPGYRTLSLGWLALLGIIFLLIVLNNNELEHLFHAIDWPTLLFLGATFVMMECVDRLGLFTWIGGKTQNIIMLVDEQYRLLVAILLILWISAIISSVLESIPVTLLMVKLVVTLVTEETLDLPLEPLVWALTFGPALGGIKTKK